MTRVNALVSLSCLLLGAMAGEASAQVRPAGNGVEAAPVHAKDPATGAFETRAELERMANEAEKAGRRSEAWLLRQRLANGDFQEGDRILLRVERLPGMSDTVIVRRGKRVELANMEDLSLDGVLRSELRDTLRQHLARYVHSPDFTVTPLIPLAIIGKVGAPGYYYLAADVVFRDVLTRARVTPQGDFNKVTIRRDGKVIWEPRDVRTALDDGLSVDRLHLRAGDEISVGGGRGFGIGTLLPFVTTGVTLYMVLNQSRRRR